MSKDFGIFGTDGMDLHHFKRRVTRDLSFGFMNAPAIAALLARKYRLRLEALLRRDPHAIGKTRPPWLPAMPVHIPVTDASALCARIPFVEGGSSAITAAPLWEESTDEPEDYFSAHRFAWLLTHDPLNPDGARDTRNRLGEWMARQRDLADRAWEPYSACERACNLISWLSLVPPKERVNLFPEGGEPFLRATAGSIIAHLEYYGKARTNNHILNNGRALVMLGRVLGSSSMHDRGVAILERMLPVMVGGGGMLRERSTHYQFVVLGWVLDAARYAATPEAEKLLAPYGRRMAGAALRLLDGRSGLAAEMGDISPDMSPGASLERLDMLHSGWQNGVAPVAGPRTDDWYFLSSGASRVMVNYPSGAYPLAYPTHGHCDLTSFVWNLGEERILVDAGRFRYTTDAVSERQRSAAGHNVPLVDGFSPLCEPFGVSGWMPTPYAAAKLEAECTAPGKLVMRHTGLERLQREMRHERTIDVHDQGIDVVDAFAGSGEHMVTLLWHFPRAFKPLAGHDGASNGRIEVTVETICKVSPAYHWFYGESAVVRVSRAYGTSESLTTLVVEYRSAFPTEIRTSFGVRPCVA